MLDVMASLLTYQAGLYWNAGGKPTRRGNQHPSIVPYEVFQAQDAYMTLGRGQQLPLGPHVPRDRQGRPRPRIRASTARPTA